MVKVKNLNGTAGRTPNGYSSWIEFWEAHRGVKKAALCRRCNKETTELDGAHVKKVNSFDNKWYIVPLCRTCNLTSGEFYVSETDLVPVVQ